MKIIKISINNYKYNLVNNKNIHKINKMLIVSFLIHKVNKKYKTKLIYSNSINFMNKIINCN